MRATSYHLGKHLKESETWDASSQCPVCRSLSVRRPVVKIQDEPLISLLDCPSCRVCSASKMPTENVLNIYYAAYYTDVDRRITVGDAARFARHVAKFMPELSQRPQLSILDFGGGDGSLAVQIAQQFRRMANRRIAAKIDLVDYAAPARTADESIEVRSHKTFPQQVDSYDLILASAILEHIPDAYSAITRLLASARRGTFLYVRTPYIAPLARIIPRIDITYPAHVHDMGPRFWSRFAATFDVNADLIYSAPSIVETTLKQAPVRTTVAHLLKFPARLELLFRPGLAPAWPLVGGWESVFHFR